MCGWLLVYLNGDAVTGACAVHNYCWATATRTSLRAPHLFTRKTSASLACAALVSERQCGAKGERRAIGPRHEVSSVVFLACARDVLHTCTRGMLEFGLLKHVAYAFFMGV